MTDPIRLHQPWPEDLARRYREAGHWRGETFGDVLRARAAATAAATARQTASAAAGKPLPSLLAALTGGGRAVGEAAWNWRQVLLTGAVTVWSLRREYHKQTHPLSLLRSTRRAKQ